MKYTFKEGYSEKINDFSKQSKKGHIFQTNFWANFKKEWNHKFITGYDTDNNIVLSSIILLRKLPILNKTMGYIPRGFVCDYNDTTLIDEFTLFLNNFCKQNNISFISIDPDIHLKENQIDCNQSISLCNHLKSIGYIENESKNFENIQPNFVFRLNIKDMTHDTILKNFSSKARYNIKLGTERGLSAEKYDFNNLTEEKLEIFQQLMDITGERDNFIVRKQEYFYNMLKELNPYCRLYLIKYSYEKDKDTIYLNINKCKTNIDSAKIKLSDLENQLLNTDKTSDIKKYEKLILKIQGKEKEIEINENQLSSLEKKLQTIAQFRNKQIYLSGAIYLYWGNKAWYLYGASNNILRDTMPNFLMQYEMIKDSIDLNCDIYDFRGVSGDLNENNPLYGLYKFKKMFNGDFVQFIGEYTLVKDKLIYKTFKNIFPKFKSIRNLISLNKKDKN